MKPKAATPVHLEHTVSVDANRDAANASSFTPILRLALAAVHLQISEATLRDLKFYSERRTTARGVVIEGNGLATAFLKIGRSVYVDVPEFCAIVRSKNAKGDRHV